MFRRRPRPAIEFPSESLLVGGAVRDLLRGRTPKDYDWLARDPERAARAVAARMGGSVFPLDLDRGYWRVDADVQHDFVPMPETVEADLWRRDFTVNAMALAPDGRVIDPTGGQADLRRGLLRMVSRDRFLDDPLRLLRAVRLTHTLAFRVEPGTRAAIIELAGAGLPVPAPERVREELHALLLSPTPARGLLDLEELGLLVLYLPQLREGIGVRQGSFHHLDVYHHGVEALHQLLARFPDADLTLRWATLLHDVGKPRSASTDPDTGRVRFHGHERIGAELTREVLGDLRCPQAMVDRAAALVKAHMVPLPFTERDARRFVHRRRALLPDLIALMLADREAARGPASNEQTRLAYRYAMALVLAALDAAPSAPEPLVRGEDVMAILGVPPGPRVGEALRAVAEAQAVGDVGTRDEAIALVRSLGGGVSPDQPQE